MWLAPCPPIEKAPPLSCASWGDASGGGGGRRRRRESEERSERGKRRRGTSQKGEGASGARRRTPRTTGHTGTHGHSRTTSGAPDLQEGPGTPRRALESRGTPGDAGSRRHVPRVSVLREHCRSPHPEDTGGGSPGTEGEIPSVVESPGTLSSAAKRIASSSNSTPHFPKRNPLESWDSSLARFGIHSESSFLSHWNPSGT